MKIVDLDDDRNCFCGDCGDYENWNIDPEAIIEIVRCKDCKHGRLFAKNCVDCEYRELATDADWFCADGERRTKDDET